MTRALNAVRTQSRIGCGILTLASACACRAQRLRPCQASVHILPETGQVTEQGNVVVVELRPTKSKYDQGAGAQLQAPRVSAMRVGDIVDTMCPRTNPTRHVTNDTHN